MMFIRIDTDCKDETNVLYCKYIEIKIVELLKLNYNYQSSIGEIIA